MPKHNSSDALNQKKAFLKATIHLIPALEFSMKQLKKSFSAPCFTHNRRNSNSLSELLPYCNCKQPVV